MPRLNQYIMESLDEIDIRLLNLLQDNSNLTTKELAQRVNLTTTPVYERVKRLEAEGYIKKYVAVLDAEKLNVGFVVYVNVRLSKQTYNDAMELINVIKGIPEVTECYNVAGNSDYLLKVQAPNMRYYREFVLEVLGRIKVIDHVESIFVMGEMKRSTAIPLKYKKR